MLLWRIYYREGRTFDSSMGAPAEAPPMGVIAVGQAHASLGRQVIRQYDFYVYYADRGWQGADIFGLVSNLLQGIQMSAVKMGDWVSDEEFQATVIRALEDPELPVKSAKRPEEVGGKARLGIDG